MDRLPSAHHPGGCKCAQCYGLAEYMHDLTGKDYGLTRAPGCPHKHAESNVIPLRPEPEPPAPRRAPVVELQPWQPRPPRFAAARMREAA